MQRLVADLSAYVALDFQGASGEETPCESALAKALELLQGDIAKSGAAVTHDALPTVTAGSRQVTKIFRNLIENAIKFRREAPPEVHVSATPQGSQWILSVRDNGIGMDPDYPGQAFQAFQPGIGLAANQVGVLQRVIVVELPEDDEDPQSGKTYPVINPNQIFLIGLENMFINMDV